MLKMKIDLFAECDCDRSGQGDYLLMIVSLTEVNHDVLYVYIGLQI